MRSSLLGFSPAPSGMIKPYCSLLLKCLMTPSLISLSEEEAAGAVVVESTSVDENRGDAMNRDTG